MGAKEMVSCIGILGALTTGCASAEAGLEAVSSNDDPATAHYEQVITALTFLAGPSVLQVDECPTGDRTLYGTNVNALWAIDRSDESLPQYPAGSVEIGIPPFEVVKVDTEIGTLGAFVVDGADHDIQPRRADLSMKDFPIQEYIAGDETVGYCGSSIGTFLEYGVNGPTIGTPTLIPNPKECRPDVAVGPENSQPLCSFAGVIVYRPPWIPED